MKMSRALSGQFQVRLSFSTDEFDEICLEALTKSGFLPKTPQAIRIDRFVEKYFQCNAGYEDLPAGTLGYSLFDAKGKVIEVRVSDKIEDGKQSSERRVRSTWAHEAGHCLLHPMLFIETPGQPTFSQIEGKNSNIDSGKILCRNNDIKPAGRSYDGRWWEWQANRCIGGLLLPKKLMGEALSNFLIDSVVTRSPILPAAKRLDAEKHLAEIFDVNPIVARIRLAEMYPDSKGQIEFKKTA
jgi:hypothetical protein